LSDIVYLPFKAAILRLDLSGGKVAKGLRHGADAPKKKAVDVKSRH